jgi:hypothetical protein
MMKCILQMPRECAECGFRNVNFRRRIANGVALNGKTLLNSVATSNI